jgi:hypothetical protein
MPPDLSAPAMRSSALLTPALRTADIVAVWANMSAPPRSTVVMPRLGQREDGEGAAPQAAAGTASQMPGAGASRTTGTADGAITVGPGGGATLSHALCFAQVDLPAALCARLGKGYEYGRLVAPLGLARALVAVARVEAATGASASAAAVRAASARKRRSPRTELIRLADLPEGALVSELAERLQAVPWPAWVPAVGFGAPLGMDPATALRYERRPPAPPPLACPLLAARLISGLRGQVFMRDAAPTLTRLLDLWRGESPSGIWEFWTPRTSYGR